MADKFDTVYICDWLPPDFGAVGQYSLILARELAAEGRGVLLAGLSSRGHGETEARFGGGRLKVLTFFARPYDKGKLTTRLLWTVKANTRLIIGLWRALRSCDEIRFTGSPPLLLHWIAPLNFLLRKRLVYRITDFHPECLMAARGRRSLWLDLIYSLTLFWRRRVNEFEVLGEDQKARLLEIGIPAGRIRLKPDPPPIEIHERIEPVGWPKAAPGKVLLLYSGNWGVAHDYRTFLQAYRLHHREGSARVVLWLNAVGTAIEAIETFLNDEKLPYFRTQPVGLEKLANILVTPDAHLITLSEAFVGFVLPSKVHGCLASNKPVLYVGSERSDIHRLCSQGRAFYLRVPTGDVSACMKALEALADHVPRASETGRAYLREPHSAARRLLPFESATWVLIHRYVDSRPSRSGC
jgi:hypothetical protein